MARFYLLPFVLAVLGQAWTEEAQGRGFLLKKLCQIRGNCGGGNGGYQGGYGGYQGGYGEHQGGYQHYQGGYQGYPSHPNYSGFAGYPPINIGISQSQSSANGAGGGYSNGNYPFNYQYNQGIRPFRPGFQVRPGLFNNGQGSYNTQFNGNYHGGNGGPGAFQGPFGNAYYDEENASASENGINYDDVDSQAGSYGFAGRKNQKSLKT